MNDTTKALTRDQIRAALIGKKHPGKTKRVKLFGVEVELHQPTLATILSAREEDDARIRTTDVYIKYAYVPGTDELVFEDTDRDTILEWPFNEDMIELQNAIAELTGVDLSDIEAEIKEDPLDEQS